MSVHQTSVYVGTAGGVLLAGMLAERYSWRSPFLVLGGLGTLYAIWLASRLIEPVRGKSETKPFADPLADEFATPAPDFRSNVGEIVSNPAATMLLAVFIGANFVATAFMTWLPYYVTERFSLSLSGSALTSTAWPLASLAGALCGGVLGDRAARRAGGRIQVQAAALLAATPFVIATAAAGTVPVIVVTLLGVGFCKGVYDASIFASLFDVVRPPIRGTAAGLMNTVGWSGGWLAPILVGVFSERWGVGMVIGATAAVYFLAGLLALVASRQAARIA